MDNTSRYRAFAYSLWRCHAGRTDFFSNWNEQSHSMFLLTVSREHCSRLESTSLELGLLSLFGFLVTRSVWSPLRRQ